MLAVTRQYHVDVGEGGRDVCVPDTDVETEAVASDVEGTEPAATDDNERFSGGSCSPLDFSLSDRSITVEGGDMPTDEDFAV